MPAAMAALERIDQAVLLYDVDAILVWASPSLESTFHWKLDTVVGTAFRMVDAGDDCHADLHSPEALALGGDDITSEVRVRRGDGAVVPASFRSVLVRDGTRAPTHVVSLVRDLSCGQRQPHGSELDDVLTFTSLVEATLDVVTYSLEGRFIWLSPNVVELTGWTADELVGTPTMDLAYGPDLEVVQESVRRRDAGQRDLSLFRIVRRDGALRWVESTARPFPRPDGRFARLGIIRDVTDQVESAAALAASEARFRLLAENSSDVVWLTDTGGLVSWVSPSVTDVLGWSPQDLVGHSPLELTHPDDVPSSVPPEQFLAGEEARTARHRLRDHAGDYRWFETTMRPVRDADGQLVGRVGGVRGIDAEVRAVRALSDSAEEYRLLVENGSDVVFRASAANVLEWVSPRVHEVLGWSPADMVGHTAAEFIPPEDLPRMLEAAAVVNAGGQGRYEARFRTADGGQLWLAVTAGPLVDDTGVVVGRVGAWRDVDSEVSAREALRASEALFRSSMQCAAIGMAIADLDRRFLVTNPSLRTMLGYDEDWFLAHSLIDVVHPDDRPTTLAAGDQIRHGRSDTVVSELRLVTAAGAPLWVRRAAVLIRDALGAPQMILLQVEDISAEREATEALAFQAFHDSLTGLRNRAWILDILNVDLAAAKRHGTMVGVLFVDLDNFKVVNDSLGHLAGDEVLATVADRISSSLRASARVGRFGGDEFVVVVPDVAHTQELELVAQRVSSAISVDLVVQGHRIVPSASIGIAVSTSVSTAESLLRDTDSALFRAKAAGRAQWQFFDSAMHAQAVQRLTIEDQLRDGLARREFVVVYQPIVSLADGAVVAHEALVRWRHPVRGLLAPAAFLDVAEESALITQIGAQVLDQVCATIVAHPALPGPVSVNVSAVELAQPSWLAGFTGTLARHGVSPDRIVVEVTETAVLSLVDSTRRGLVELRDMGVGIHVDDFGTGFSSISVLRDVPVTGLKLDRRFVSDLTEGHSPANALATGLSGLVAGLGLVGIAEGVETAEQVQILRSLGWHLGQGYYFARPAPMTDEAPAHGPA